MEKQIGIIGGDLRIALLAELLAKENWKVYCYGFENYSFENSNIQKKEIWEDNLPKEWISAVPFTKDGIRILTPFSKKEIFIKDVLEKLQDSIIYAGAIPKECWQKKAQNQILVDLLQQESLTIQNAISTVEGTIQIILEKSPKNIYKRKILICGFGRIGKLLANRLQSFGAQIFCEARKKEDLIWIEAYGYKSIPLSELSRYPLEQFDILINTIPSLILTENEIQKLNPDCFVIDLASTPGGVDRQAIAKRKILFQWALGLPGKVAPLSSAEFLKQTWEQIREK